MKIIKYIKKGNKYDITLENQQTISLYPDLILKYDLLIKKEIDNNILKKIEDDNLVLEGYYKTLRYLKNIKCTKDIENYLKEYDDFTRKEIINRLKKEKYLDDNNYIKSYINTKILLSNDGYYKIYNYLKNKDLEINTIKEELDLVDDNIWRDKIERIVNTRLKSSKNDSQKMFILKTKGYLKNLGYQDTLIDEVISKVEVDSSKEDDNLRKEYLKIYNKYKSKYDYKKLKTILMRKLYQKGYDMEKIKALFEKNDL